MNLQLGGKFGYWLLKALCKRPQHVALAAQTEEAHPGPAAGAARLEKLLGRDVWTEFRGERVLDFGCGCGDEAVAVAMHGAGFVVGTDIQHERLRVARKQAIEAGVADRCLFLHAFEQADEIEALAGTLDRAYSLDAFEHFGQPAAVLHDIDRMLAPGGTLAISFGPPWKHPYGSHMRYFCRWPWIHLLFREETIMAVRALYRDDGARRFAEVEGGLNQMTLARFESVVAESSFVLDQFRPVPLSTRFVDSHANWQSIFTNRWLCEYATSVAICRLVKRTSESTSMQISDFSQQQTPQMNEISLAHSL